MTAQPGGRAARMDDVARRAGVALGTVSNVLNNPAKVSEATRARVEQAIRELGFVPNRRARALAAGTSSTIGFVVVDLGNSFFLDMARGAEQRALESDLHVLMANSDMDADKERFYLGLFDEERVAGVLLAPLPETRGERLPTARTPVVVLNACPGPDQCCVTVDNELGGYLAARHLIDGGRRNLVFASGPESLLPLRARRRGVEKAVRESNGAVVLSVLEADQVQAEDGRKVGARIASLGRRERPDGVVAAADLLALGILQHLLSYTDMRVPEDLAVIGYDDNRAAWDSAIPISTIGQPGEEMGRVATRLLLEEIGTPAEHEHQHAVLEPRLIVRRSSGRP